MEVSVKEKLKDRIKKFFTNVAPGYLQIIDAIAKSRYGCDAVELLLTSPCNLLKLLQEFYGSETVAKFMMKLFIRALGASTPSSDVETLVKSVASCRDEELAKIIKSAIKEL